MTTATTQRQIVPQKQFETLRSLLEKNIVKLQEVAPKHLKAERLVRLLLSACSRNHKLLQCTTESVMLFCMKCAETGLEPIGAGGMWPVPYKNSKNGMMEMQAIPDYRGLVNCAKRAGCILDAYAEVVHTNDEFDYELGEIPKIHVHKPARGDRGELECAYCVIERSDGTKRPIVMCKDEIESIRNRSQAWRYSAKDCPWTSDVGEMWKKTVIRRAMKPFSGMAASLDAAIELDDVATGIEFAGRERAPVALPRAIGELAPELADSDVIDQVEEQEIQA